MWNFIKEFIEKKLKEENMQTKNSIQTDNSNLTNWDKEKQPIKYPKKSTISINLVNKNNNMLENNKKQVDNAEKWNNKRILFWILFQFIVWSFLIFFSYTYLQKHDSEMKFFDSSISYWKNLGLNIYSKLWWNFKKEVDDEYLKKRWEMIVKLDELSFIMNKCILNEKDEELKKEYKQLQWEINSLKGILSNTFSLPLETFKSRYQYYSLWLNSYVKTVNERCK